MNEMLQEGDLIEYQWRKNTIWKQGRIKKIEFATGWKANYLIEEFKMGKVIDWEVLVNGCNSGKIYIDTKGKEILIQKEDWYTVKWFSKEYIRKIN